MINIFYLSSFFQYARLLKQLILFKKQGALHFINAPYKIGDHACPHKPTRVNVNYILSFAMTTKSH